MRIKEIAIEQRPRERLKSLGSETLSDAELLADEEPDQNLVGQSRTGTIVDGTGNLVVDTPGVFVFSRRSAPFGINGAYYYLAADFSF